MVAGHDCESFLACDVCERFSKVCPGALDQAVSQCGEVGPMMEPVGMFVPC